MSSRELAATPKDLAMLAHSITAYLAALQKQPRTKRERVLSVTLTDVRENIQRALKNGGGSLFPLMNCTRYTSLWLD